MNYKQIDERTYLAEQYKTKDNLQVRIETHQKYTEPIVDFISFVLDLIPWTGQERVIDVGCGAGAYVEAASERCGTYYACDLSFGMLQGLPMAALSRVNLDAQRLPFASNTADVILANHMLYHVPDQDAAVGAIYRVLKPGGYLLAATNSDDNMPELSEIRQAMVEKFGFSMPKLSGSRLTFYLENGSSVLERHFNSVHRRDLDSALVFRSSQPVVDYINTSRDYYMGIKPEEVQWKAVEAAIHKAVNGRIAKDGAFRVQKLTGVFVCQKDVYR
jgi:ubiquinone/menaquinone biosynthesis C-methylase UbiE